MCGVQKSHHSSPLSLLSLGGNPFSPISPLNFKKEKERIFKLQEPCCLLLVTMCWVAYASVGSHVMHADMYHADEKELR